MASIPVPSTSASIERDFDRRHGDIVPTFDANEDGCRWRTGGVASAHADALRAYLQGEVDVRTTAASISSVVSNAKTHKAANHLMISCLIRIYELATEWIDCQPRLIQLLSALADVGTFPSPEPAENPQGIDWARDSFYDFEIHMSDYIIGTLSDQSKEVCAFAARLHVADDDRLSRKFHVDSCCLFWMENATDGLREFSHTSQGVIDRSRSVSGLAQLFIHGAAAHVCQLYLEGRFGEEEFTAEENKEQWYKLQRQWEELEALETLTEEARVDARAAVAEMKKVIVKRSEDGSYVASFIDSA